MIPKNALSYIKDNFKGGSIVCMTGAGISSESGIPTFRGKGGLWERYDPKIYGSTEALSIAIKTRPQDVVNFLLDFYSVLLKARPSPAHLALAVLEKAGILSTIITQNIDNLHQMAGSRNVIELHGNAFKIRCEGCAKTLIFERDRIKEMLQLLKISQSSPAKLLRILIRYFPRCSCGRRYRTDIVLFGDMLPKEELSLARKHLENCNALLVVGSSLVVYPAAGLPFYAKDRGAKLMEINTEPSDLSDICDYQIIGRASEVLPEILEILNI